VFVSARFVLDWVIGPRTRANELCELRRRLLAQDGLDVASPAETELALRLRRQREELSALLGPVEACAHCVRPRMASWPGGHCCSGNTRDIFTDDELSALRLAGTTSTALEPPRTGHVGCAFRGSSGCSLAAPHRPNLCVSYLCRELESELERRGDGQMIAQLQQGLRTGFERFLECRKERIEKARFEELQACLRERTD
jgi:hypothetical protein